MDDQGRIPDRDEPPRAISHGGHAQRLSEDNGGPRVRDCPSLHPRCRSRAVRLGTATIGVGVVAIAAAAVLSGGAARLGVSPHPLPQPHSTVRRLDPAGFAPGACVAYAPTRGDRHRTVFLDAGHGGPDPGSLGTAGGSTRNIAEEKQATLPTVLDAARLLRAEGYRVVVSRTRDTAVARLDSGDVTAHALTARGDEADLRARVRCANISGASALISVHFDAADDPSATGAQTLYDPARPFSARSARLAELLQRDVIASLRSHGWQVPNDGVTGHSSGGGAHSSASRDYGHLFLLGPAMRGYNDHPSRMPGALIEPLFISNPTEGRIATSSAGQHALASGIVAAVREFLRNQGTTSPSG
jgi:N-acetylmuramoyl-L-alanine amidase